MSPTLNLIVKEHTDEPLREQLIQHLRDFNDAVSPWHRDIRADGGQPLDVFAYDDQKQLIGGIICETYWGWLSIDYLWIAEQHRHSGLGSLLLLEAETIAIENRDCRHAKVSSFSFQAPGFYQNLGYEIAGQLPDYPPGETLFWLHKNLAGD